MLRGPTKTFQIGMHGLTTKNSSFCLDEMKNKIIIKKYSHVGRVDRPKVTLDHSTLLNTGSLKTGE